MNHAFLHLTGAQRNFACYTSRPFHWSRRGVINKWMIIYPPHNCVTWKVATNNNLFGDLFDSGWNRFSSSSSWHFCLRTLVKTGSIGPFFFDYHVFLVVHFDQRFSGDCWSCEEYHKARYCFPYCVCAQWQTKPLLLYFIKSIYNLLSFLHISH